MRGHLLYVLFILLITAVVLPPLAAQSMDNELLFEIYGEPACPHCRATNATLNELFPGHTRFYDINVNATALRIYIELWRAVVKEQSFGVPFVVVSLAGKPRAFVVGERTGEWWRDLVKKIISEPPATALLCISYECTELSPDDYKAALSALKSAASGVNIAFFKGFQEDLLKGLFTEVKNSSAPSSLAGVLGDSRSYALVCGWNAILVLIERDVPERIVVSNQTIEIDRTVLGIAERLSLHSQHRGRALILRVYLGEEGEPMLKAETPSEDVGRELLRACGLEKYLPPPITHTLMVLAGLALSDAVNPCAVFIYTTLLIAATLASAGRKRLPIATGTAFVLAVYLGYLAIGLGLMTFLRYVPTWILGFVAIAFGLWVIVSDLVGRSRIVARESLLDMISRAATSTFFSFLLGLLVTFTLLPCSSGPYVVFAGIASRYDTPIAVALLAMYNLVFVTPLLAVMVLVVAGLRYRSVQRFIIEHKREMSIAAGLLLIAVGIYVLLGL